VSRNFLRFPKFLSGSLARATLNTSAVLALRLLIQAASLLIVTWLLGASQFGAFSGVAALAILSGNMGTAGTHFVLLAEVSIAPARRNAILSWALPITFSFVPIIFCFYLSLAIPLLQLAGLSCDIALAIGIAEILIQPFVLLVVMERHARGEIARSQMLQTLPLFFRLIAAIVISVIQPDNTLSVFAWSYLAVTLAAFLIIMRQRPEKWPSWHTWHFPAWHEFRHSLGFASLQFTASGMVEADKTLALYLTPPNIAGIYAAATRIISALVLPVTSMMLSAQPRLFRQQAEDSQNSGKLRYWIFFITLAYGILASLCIAVGASLIEKLFGATYTGLSGVLRLLSFVIPALCLQIAAGTILMTQNSPWQRTILESFGLIILVVAAFIPDSLDPSTKMPFALGCAQWCLAIAGWFVVFRKQI
jgi:O-antigen/teichoic acid export membrane protein